MSRRSAVDRAESDALMGLLHQRAADALPELPVPIPVDPSAPVSDDLRRALAHFAAQLAPTYELAFAERASMPDLGFRVALDRVPTDVGPALDTLLAARDYADYDDLEDPMRDAGTLYGAAVAARAYFFGCAATGRDPFDDRREAWRRRPALLRLAVGVARQFEE